MSGSVKKAILFVNLHKKNSVIVSNQINDELKKHGIGVHVFSFEGKPETPPQGDWDIAFSLGGDGTVLYTARCLASKGVPILPVNLGNLGFIAAVDRTQWPDVFNRWEKGEIIPSKRCMFEVTVERESNIIMRNTCLNDIVMSASGIAKLIKLDVFFSSQNIKTSLGSYRCDGLIAATPTGSSAYSMAAGGPILDPEMEAVIINPICPFALSNRPLVLPSSQAITVNVVRGQRTGVMLTIDGQYMFKLEEDDNIHIKQSPYPAFLINSGRQAYYSALRNKLFWLGDNIPQGDIDA